MIVALRALSGKALESHLLIGTPGLGLFVPTTQLRPDGTRVWIEVHVGKGRIPTVLRGTVLFSRPASPRNGIRAGMGVAIDFADVDRWRYLQRLIRDESTAREARVHRRFPVEWPVTIALPQSPIRQDGRLEEISVAGARVLAQPPPVGQSLILEGLLPGGVRSLALAGRVVWISAPDSRAQFGLAFSCRDSGGLRRLREIVRRLISGTEDWV